MAGLILARSDRRAAALLLAGFSAFLFSSCRSTPSPAATPLDLAASLPEAAMARNRARLVSSFFWRSHVLALLNNPASTVARIGAGGASITHAGLSRLFRRLPATSPPPLRGDPEMDPETWRRILTNIASAPETDATLRFRIGGGEFFPEFERAARGARHEIDLQLFIFDNDEYATGIANLLRRRSLKGVRVRVLTDEAASLQAAAEPPARPPSPGFTPPENILSYLRRDSAVRVRTTPMSGLSASHTKIITVDDEVAWLGGMNIGREYRYDWHDLMVEVRGPLVEWIRKDFSRAWARNGWAGDLAAARAMMISPARAARTSASLPGAVPVQPLYTSTRRSEILDAQIAALRHCRRQVLIQNAYLSDHDFITELVRARHRGVDVRVIFPAENDIPVMAANNLALLPLLRRHGIRVYLLPGMSHVKAALYDGWACLGSANFDRLSLRVNNEFSIGFSDPALVAELRRRLFLRDLGRSREVLSVEPATSAGDFRDAVIRTIAGQL